MHCARQRSGSLRSGGRRRPARQGRGHASAPSDRMIPILLKVSQHRGLHADYQVQLGCKIAKHTGQPAEAELPSSDSQPGAGHTETFKAVATLEEMPKWQLVMQVLQVWRKDPQLSGCGAAHACSAHADETRSWCSRQAFVHVGHSYPLSAAWPTRQPSDSSRLCVVAGGAWGRQASRQLTRQRGTR